MARIGNTETGSDLTSASIDVTIPAHADGDHVLVILANDTARSWDTPTDWYQITTWSGGGGAVTVAAFYRQAPKGGISSPVNFSTSAGSEETVWWSGQIIDAMPSFFDSAVVLTSGSITTNYDVSGATTKTKGALVIHACGRDGSGGFTTVPATEIANLDDATAVGLAISSNVIGGPSDGETKEFVLAASDNAVGVSFAIRDKDAFANIRAPATIRRKWTKQPPENTPIDFENPLTRNLVFMGPTRDARNGVPNTPLGSAVATVGSTAILNDATINGRALTNPDNDTGGYQWTDTQLFNDAEPVSMLVYANPAADTTAQSLMAMSDGIGQAGGFGANVDELPAPSSGQLNFSFRIDASNRIGAASTATNVIDGTWKIFAATGTPGTVNDIVLYVDGIAIAMDKATTGNVTNWTSTTQSTALMKSAEGGVNSVPLGSCVLGLAWNRILSAEEVKTLSDNPWQIFKPKTIFIPKPRDRRLVVF